MSAAMKSIKTILLASTLMIAQTALATTYYVAKGGSDSNAGTSLTSPFLTIQKAATVMAAGDTCFIRKGTYRETVTPAHSGTAAAPITFSAYASESVVVSGANVLNATWSVHSGSIYKATTSSSFRQLFVDGDMMNEARWPNARTDDLLEAPRASIDSGTLTSLTDASMPTVNLVGATLHLFPGNVGGEWSANTRTITSQNTSTKTIFWATDASYTVNAGNPYYIYGALGLLDIPTEWYLDDAANTVYLWTPDGASPAAHTIEIKARSEAFVLDNRSHVNVTGLYIFAAGITMKTATSCTVDNCHMRYVQHDTTASWGIPEITATCISSGSNNAWQNSSIHFSSQDGIQLNGTNDTVTNCVILDTDYYPGSYQGAIATKGASGQKILNNTLSGSGRFLVWPTASAIEVAYNDMSWGQRLTKDGGSLYIYGFDGTGTTIHHNWVHNDNRGIYLDNGTSNFTVYRNVCFNNQYGMQLNSPGKNHKIYNNTLIGNSESIRKPSGSGTITEAGTQVFNTLADASMTFAADCTTDKNGWFPTVGTNFVPQTGSLAIDRGRVIPGFTDGYHGSAPDIGCYETGAAYWIPGASFAAPAFPTPDATVVPPAPTAVVATAITGGIDLSWTASAAAVSYYNIKRSTTSGGPYTIVDTVDGGTHYVDSGLNPGTYYYVISAVNSIGESSNSGEASPHTTVTSADGFFNRSLGSSQTGSFSVDFDASVSLSPSNTSFSLCQGNATAYTGLACMMRFNSTGTIDARNGGAFAAVTSMPFSANTTYHVRMDVNVATHTYSVSVTAPGGSPVTIASNYAFRTEQAAVTSLDTFDVNVNATPGGSAAFGPTTVNLAPTTFTVTASAGSNGSISPSGAVTVNQGANKTFTITPNSGFAVSSVTVDGTNVGAVTTYTFSNVQANHTISAAFVANTFTITASAGSNGSISPTGAVTVNQGSSQTFTITPNSGFSVSSVTVDGTSVGAVTTYTFSNVQANHTISATFVANSVTFTITANAGSGGTISPTGAVTVNQGSSQAFTITANSGFAISSVTVDGTNVGAVATYTFSNVQANHTISAAFSATAPTEINDTDAGIVYTGTWSYSANRTHGEYQADVHFTAVNGDSVSYTFNGTGISFITETNTDEGNVSFYIDNVLQQTVSCVSSTRIAQVAVYTASGLSSGTHTLKAVKVDGTYMLIDALIVTSTSSPVAAPTFTPGGGTYSSAQTVTIGTTTTGATIRYTVDGSAPSETNGTIYTGPIVISSNTTLKAIAYKSGMTDSTVSSATYAFSVTVTVATGFYNQALPTAQTGTFTAQFDAISSVSPANAVVSLSQGAAAAYTDMAVAVRFNTTGAIDARNGGAFAAASTIPFTAGTSYHFRLVINVAAHTYSAYVTPAGGSEIAIGTNYAFRTEQAAVTQLDTWNADVNATPGGSMTVSNVVAQ
jgi:hypothetical protein